MKTIPNAIKTEVIQFYTGENQKLLGRNKKGKVVFPKKSDLIKTGESWEIEIVKEMAKFIVAIPLFKVKTVDENKKEFDNSLKKLVAKFQAQ